MFDDNQILRCHHPPPGLAFGEPMTGSSGVIQYSRAARDYRKLRRTGYSAFAEYDG